TLAAPAAAVAPAPSKNGSANGVANAPIPLIAEADMPLCSNCKTCYQTLPEIFEKTTIVVDGAVKEVAHVIPGVLAKLEITPELVRRAARAAAECDSEIIK
ncbi:MAG: ferredoxin, partial [Candidatus Velthaea sp.]